MIYSCFILGNRYKYTSFNWKTALTKLKKENDSLLHVEEINMNTIEEIKEFIMDKFEGDIELVTTSTIHDPDIKDLSYHVSIVLPEYIGFSDLHEEIKNIKKTKIKKYKKCLKYFDLSERDPMLYSIAYRK